MSNWLSWDEVLNQGIKDFELLEYLKEGLQPYSRPNKPIYCPYDFHRYKYLDKKHSRFNNLIKAFEGSNTAEKISSKGTELRVFRLDDYPRKSIEKYNREAAADNRIQIHDHVFVDLHEQSENLRKFKQHLEKKRQKTIKEMEDIIDADSNLNEDQKKLSWKYFIIPDSEEKFCNIISELETAFFKKDDIKRFAEKKEAVNTLHSEKKNKKLRPNQKAKLEVQEVGKVLWFDEERKIRIKDMKNRPEILKTDGKHYSEKQRHRWLSEIAPEWAKKKGRPKGA